MGDLRISIKDIYDTQNKLRLKHQCDKFNNNNDYDINDPYYNLKVQLYNHDLEKIIELIGFEKIELYIRKQKIKKLKKLLK